MIKKQLLLTLALTSTLSGCSSESPQLGLVNNSLKICPESPNCVSSMINKKDEEHFIAAVNYSIEKTIAYQTLLTHLKSLKDVQLVSKTDSYLHTTFTTPWMRFVDDVEFYFPPSENVIHIRSASRVGRSDMGLNRKRVETLRQALKEKFKKPS